MLIVEAGIKTEQEPRNKFMRMQILNAENETE